MTVDSETGGREECITETPMSVGSQEGPVLLILSKRSGRKLRSTFELQVEKTTQSHNDRRIYSIFVLRNTSGISPLVLAVPVHTTTQQTITTVQLQTWNPMLWVSYGRISYCIRIPQPRGIDWCSFQLGRSSTSSRKCD